MPDHNQNTPTLVCLHFLGGSAATWSAVAAHLAGRMRCLPLDLNGFGAAAQQPGYSVSDMADSIAAQLVAAALGDWMIAGHSMGAKVAAALARRAEDGEEGLAGLRGIALLAGSPPGPEPMAEDKRQTMLGWFTGDRAAWPAQARDYLEGNVAEDLDPETLATATNDLLRMHPGAWAAWLRDGSREDWAARIGVLRTPALILAGSEDDALGEDAQRRLTAPHYASHRLLTLNGAAHLLPMEQPETVARLLAEHLEQVAA